MKPVRATCPRCKRKNVRVTKDGVLFTHRGRAWGHPKCSGSGLRPATDVGLSGVADAHWAAVERKLEEEA